MESQLPPLLLPRKAKKCNADRWRKSTIIGFVYSSQAEISRVHSENISQTFQNQGIHSERPGTNQGG